jgi:N-methylhydantoinase A
LRVEVPDPAWSLAEIRAAFERVYWNRFRVELERIEANVVNVATTVVGRRPVTDLSRLIDPAGRRATTDAASTGARRLVTGSGAVEAAVYWRDHLPLDARIRGPALIEQMDTTVLVEPGWQAVGDVMGNLMLEMSR